MESEPTELKIVSVTNNCTVIAGIGMYRTVRHAAIVMRLR
jgi:hypothetical protein